MIRVPSTAAPLALCVVLILAGCGPPRASDPEQKPRHEAESTTTVHLSQAQQQLVHLQMAEATLRPWEDRLRVTGQIAQDTDRLTHVTPSQAGMLKHLLVRVGDQVNTGQSVATLEVTGSAPEPLEVPAPSAGFVIATPVSEGASVDRLSSLVTIADLSQVWATFDIYEKDVGHVQMGQRIEVKTPAYPETVFPGTIHFISPNVDETSRTIKARALVENLENRLKLGMFVTGELIEASETQVVVVPAEAVTPLNETAVVFVPSGAEDFLARPVDIGRTTQGFTEIRQGVTAGERIVTHGSFQLKSELLKESFGAGERD